MVIHWSLSDSKSPKVSRTLFRILAVLNNAAVWIVSTRPPTSKSSSPYSNPLVTVPKAPITIDIIVTCMFHRFSNSLARSRCLQVHHTRQHTFTSYETRKSNSEFVFISVRVRPIASRKVCNKSKIWMRLRTF